MSLGDLVSRWRRARRQRADIQRLPRAERFDIPITRVFPSLEAHELASDAASAARVDTRVIHPAAQQALTMPVFLPANRAPPGTQAPPDGPLGCEFHAQIATPALRLTRVRDAVIVPSGVVVANRGEGPILRESFDAPWMREPHHYLLRDGEDAFHFHWMRAVHGVVRRPLLYMCNQHVGHLGVAHYGHFIVDVLTRLWAFDVVRQTFGVENLAVAISSETPFVRAHLKAFGLRDDQIVTVLQEVICDDLIVPTKSMQLHEYATPQSTQTWRRLRDGGKLPGERPRRIYLSRSRYHQRPMRNELEVERVFAERGFAIVHPQLLPPSEQVSLVADAELIAGAGGSNMFNLIFIERARAALIVTSPLLMLPTEQMLLANTGCSLTFYVGEVTQHERARGDVHATYYVEDISAFARDVDAWIAANSG